MFKSSNNIYYIETLFKMFSNYDDDDDDDADNKNQIFQMLRVGMALC